MVRRAIQTARKLGHGAIVLVGDPAYYSRFGFSGEKTGALWMPGPFERHRLLGRRIEARRARRRPRHDRCDRPACAEPDLAALIAQDRRTARAPPSARGVKTALKFIVDAARKSRRPPFRSSQSADITRYCVLEVLK